MNRTSVIGLLLLSGAASLQAEDFTFTPVTIAAGGVADVELNLNCEADKWGGFQLDVILPEGFSVYEDEDGLYAEQEDRLSFTYRSKTEYFGIDMAQVGEGTYRILVDNNRGKTIGGTEGGLLLLRLVCDPTVATGEYAIGLSRQKLANIDGTESAKPSDNARAGTVTVEMNTVIGSTGYATYSWPLQLDFTDTGVEAYVATEYDNGWMHLEAVKVVPPFTGLILKGEPGTYHPVTSSDGQTQDDVAGNILTETASGPVKAASGDELYALAQHDGKVGLYHVGEGVTVPACKACFRLPQNAGAPAYIQFDGITTAIRRTGDGRDGGSWIRVDGTVTEEPRTGGVYVNQGRKILVK